MTLTVNEIVRYYDKLSRMQTDRVPGERDYDAAAKYLRWCVVNDVDEPLLFMWLRFRALRTKHRGSVRPGLQRMHSNALLPRYKSMLSLKQRNRDLEAQMRTQYVCTMISIDSTHEAVRRRHALDGKRHLCMSTDLGGGYHPYSMWCEGCPIMRECSEALNAKHGYDVAALRRGDITNAPQRVLDVIG